MTAFISRSLMVKLMVILVLVALVPLVIVGAVSFFGGRTALQMKSMQMMSAIRDVQRGVLVDFLRDTVATTTFLADYDRVEMALESLSPAKSREWKSYTDAMGAPEDSKDWIIFTRLSRFLEFFLSLHRHDGYEDVLVIRPDGEVVFTVNKLDDLGQNLESGDLKNSSLARVWKKVVETKRPAIVDFTMYGPATQPGFFVGAPVLTRKDKRFCGVLALRIGPQRINKTMRLPESAGKTAETYLVGSDKLMRSQSKFAKDSTVMETEIATESVNAALGGREGAHVIKDHSGRQVLSAYGQARTSKEEGLGADFEWTLLAQIHKQEALRPAVALALKTLGLGIAVAVAAIVLAFLVARSLSGPIKKLAEVANTVSRGDLTVKVPDLKRHDEIGTLGHAFSLMVENLRGHVSRLAEGVSVLSSSVSQITATVSQLTETVSETSSSVTETTTTVEEVRQSADVASQKAKDVANTSRQAVNVSSEGKKATEDTVRGMNLIKEQMESIGETVGRLSEHSLAIERIIETVQDLADQSNLLAVNASIEAARAGDQGKGFAVVAGEIKSLADESREATDQIRAILQDTRTWVSAVVMATEQGSKAVDAGVQQSLVAGESITVLANNVSASSQAASIIEASIDQQFTGVEQVSGAMAHINEAIKRNLSGAQQLQEAAQRLAELSSALKFMAEEYKL